MTERDELGRELRELRDAIEPIETDLSDAVRRGIDRDPVPRRRPLAVAAAAILVAGILVLLIPPARTAVASWLGIGNTRVDIVDELPAVTPATFPTVTVDPDDLDDPRRPDEGLTGPLDAAYERDLGGGIAETVLSYPRVTISWTAAESEIEFVKSVEATTAVSTAIVTDGRPALWIDGLHTRTIGDTTELVDQDTLIWVRDRLEFRIVGSLSLEDAIAIAESMA